MNHWRRELRKNCEQFQKEAEAGMTFGVMLFDAYRGLTELMQQGDAGDKRARNIIIAFTNWCRHADQAIEDGGGPLCFGCSNLIERNDVAAIGYVAPMEQEGTMGLITVLCSTCRDTLSFDEAFAKLNEGIEQEFNAEVIKIGIQ